jgi:GT2 family glycosyltransferase
VSILPLGINLKSKRLTIVTTTYKSGKYLQRYFENILELKNLDEMRIIFVQNQPDEFEREMVDNFARKHKDLFHLIRMDIRESIGASTNRGFALADTPYITYQDVDDIRLPESYNIQMLTLENHPEADLTYGDVIVVQAQGRREGKYLIKPDFNQFSFIQKPWTGGTQLFRKSVLEKVGGWDEQFLSGGDFEFQARTALSCDFIKTPGLMLYYTRFQGSGSASSGSLQGIEKALIELRFGNYDRVDPQYIKYLRKYRANEILIRGEWHPISAYAWHYPEFMLERKRFRPFIFKNMLLTQIYGYYYSSRLAIKTAIKSLLSVLGVGETLVPKPQKKQTRR